MNERLTLRLSDRLAAFIERACMADDLTPSEYVRELLRREMKGCPVLSAPQGNLDTSEMSQ